MYGAVRGREQSLRELVHKDRTATSAFFAGSQQQ